MKITYLIGNGFDIGLGMRTRYSNFYEYYNLQSDSTKNSNISKLKAEIRENSDNWSDLEEAFGLFTKQLKEPVDVKILYDDITKHLNDYLIKEEKRYVFSNEHIEKIRTNFVYPYKGLRENEVLRVKAFLSKNKEWEVNIINFNYTGTLKKILGYNGTAPIEVRAKNNDRKYLINNIFHIHGELGGRMILGVNDTSQIENETFRSNNVVNRRLVKRVSNSTFMENHEQKCVDLIVNSDIICIYGSSIGITDKFWWELIGNHVSKTTCILIVFDYNPTIKKEGNWGPDFEDYVDEIKDSFILKTNISRDNQNDFRNRTFVNVNSRLFDLRLQSDNKLK